jgi:transketolase
MVATHFGLDNLVAIVDCNKLQVEGPTSEVMNLEPLRSKWEAFGWSVQEIDGHDIPQITGALEEAKDSDFKPGKPRVIIAHTVKGKGVSFMENDWHWHAGHLTEEQYQLARKELWG